jgi:hypothetical protein
VAGSCGTVVPGGGTGYDCWEKGFIGCCAAGCSGTRAAAAAGKVAADAFRFFFNGLPQFIQKRLVSGFFVPHSPQNIKISLFSAYPVLI